MLPEIRKARPEDLAAITAIARLTLVHDPISPGLVREKIFDHPWYDPALTLVAQEQGQVVGFVAAILKTGGQGWLLLGGVRPDRQRQGIGRRLYRAVEQALQYQGLESLRVMDHPQNYLSPGLDFRYTAGHLFLRSQGFERAGHNINLSCNLTDLDFDLQPWIAQQAQAGLVVRRASRQDQAATLTLIRESFPNWEHEVKRGFGHTPPTHFIACYQERVVGFCAYDTNNVNTGHFGPMGVHPAWRGQGLGGLLTLLALQALYLQGQRYAVIPWVGPIAFYARICQAQIARLFWTYVKKEF